MKTARQDTTPPATEDGHGSRADSPTEIPAKGWKDVGKRLLHRAKHEHLSLSAAGVAFFLFLAAIPSLAALVSIYGLVAEPGQVRDRVESLFGTLPRDARNLLVDQLQRIIDSSGGALSIGLATSLAVALWSASSGMSHLLEAIDMAYAEEREQKFLKKRARALAFTLGGIALAIVTVTGMTLVDGLILRILVFLGVAVLFVGALAILYRHGTTRDDPRWRWASPGAIVALVLWAATTLLFQLYVANFSSYDATYGSLAAVVLLMLFLFLTALAILLGAHLNAELEHQTAEDTTVGPDRPLGQRDAEMADTVGART